MLRWIPAAAMLVVALIGAPVPAGAQTAPLEIAGATTVDADKVIALVEAEKDLVILDNRRQEDFNAGHIAGAIRILDTDLTEAKMASLVPSKTRPVLCYCNGVNCGRAAKAAQMAVGWGYTRIYYYALGMDEWKKLGLPLASAQ
ncbi:MAG: rhodanese-like domain-containing protein [Alphaproteobacteria bacterium]|nr:rhodanese-like domain-containing protein [Alphaproteobacteria bacterium]